jgi:hypothetical protein
MDSAQIRHRNFMALYQRFRDANSHLPGRGMLKIFAGHLGLSERYLSHLKCGRKNMGNSIARSIETTLGLEHGWMDRIHGNENLTADSDEAETLFLETAKALYRSDPERARKALMDLLRRQLLPPK